MYPLGHAGIGGRLGLSLLREKARLPWILAGTLLPDLIDKPLYYFFSWNTGRWSREIGLISGTRTFGHTLVFLCLLSALSLFERRRSVTLSLSVGVGTHLLIDRLFEVLSGGVDWTGFLFPFLGLDFADAPFKSGQDHFLRWLKPENLVSEVLGAYLLFRMYLAFRTKRFRRIGKA